MPKGLTKHIGSIAFYVLTLGLFLYAAYAFAGFHPVHSSGQSGGDRFPRFVCNRGRFGHLVDRLPQGSKRPAPEVHQPPDRHRGHDRLDCAVYLRYVYRSGQNGSISALTQNDIRNVIFGLSMLIGLNLISAFAFHVMNPENMRKMREEAAHDAVQSSLLQQIEDEAEHLAQQMTPLLFAQWKDKFQGTFNHIDMLGLGKFDQIGKSASSALPVHSPAPLEAKDEPSGLNLPNPDSDQPSKVRFKEPVPSPVTNPLPDPTYHDINLEGVANPSAATVIEPSSHNGHKPSSF